MPDHPDGNEVAEENLPPSKSALKRQMTALQELGETLVTLSERQLQKIPIDNDELKNAIQEARRIRSNSARRRHLQFIGKLMRNIDPEPIAAAIRQMDENHRQVTDDFHQLEALRDLVLQEGDKGIQKVVERWPDADRQQLRQLLRQHQHEHQQGKPPAASRKLFRYLRELQGD